MELIVRSLAGSLLTGIGCSIFFGTVLPRRGRSEYLPPLAFAVGFFLIAVTEAPGHLLQPVRVVILLGIVIQIFYKGNLGKIILLAVFWCALYWVMNLLALSAIYVLPRPYESIPGLLDWLCDILLICLTLIFRYKCRDWSDSFGRTGWSRFGWLPVISILVTTLLSMYIWYTDSIRADSGALLAAAVGYCVINVLAFYFIGNILEKEAQVQKARLMQEKLENQMEMYRNTQESETRCRRYLHDYKNQLGCIHGMLKAGEVEDALDYIEELNSGIRKGEDCVDTNHLVVNTVLNQKYQYARERGITMVMSVNDLSGLTMSKEDIVALLVNLLDNAVEACEKLDGNKIIQFKMMLEEEELTVSVRNPVKEPVVIKGKRILTTKREKDAHGIGFLNINSVIEKNHGTSVLKCQDGWFYFSAVLHI